MSDAKTTPIPCPHCNRPPVIDHSQYGYRCACPNRNRVAGRVPHSARAGGACPNDARLHWRKSEEAAIRTWNAQGAGVEYDSRVRVADGERCPHCHLLLPCHDCPGERHYTDRFVMARRGEQ